MSLIEPYITFIASLISILGIIELVRSLHKFKNRLYFFLLLALTLISGLAAVYTWTESKNLKIENTALRSARVQANELLKTWPNPDRFEFVSTGEFKGIVISGMELLELNKALFPDTYDLVKSQVVYELELAKNDNNFVSKRSNLQEAAKTMVTIIKTIQLNKPHDDTIK